MITLYTTRSGSLTDAELGFSVLKAETVQPLLSETRDRTIAIAGRHGAYDFGADLQPVMFLFNCFFTSDTTPAQIQTSIRTLNAFLLDKWGNPEDMELTFDAETDKYYNVRYSGSTTIDTTVAMNRRRFTLPLIAFDPYAYASTEGDESDDIDESPEELSYSVTTGINVPLTITLDNDGEATIAGFELKTFSTIFDYTGG